MDEDGIFIFRTYTTTGKQLSEFEDLEEESLSKIIKDYKQNKFAVIRHVSGTLPCHEERARVDETIGKRQ